MWWNLIGAASMLVGLILVWSVMVKKFPQLKLIDLSTLARERHAETKSRIIRDRFERSIGSWWGKAKTASAALDARFGGFYGKLYGRLKLMERRLDESVPLDPEALEARVSTLMAEAAALAGQEAYAKAEEQYIEILRLDPKRLEAYRGLADVYMAQRQYDQAKETLEFLVRLNAEDDGVFERLGALAAMSGDYSEAEAQFLKSIAAAANPAPIRAELGQVYLTMGDYPKAHEQFREALHAEPYNPKYLDWHLETSIAVGDTIAAEEAFEALETVNPENQKLADFRERIEKLRPEPAS